MSANETKVDVLAVMDSQHEDFISAGNYSGEGCWFDTSTEERAKQDYMLVRAAVAELIEAAKRANGDHTAPHDCYATGPLTGNRFSDLVSCPGCALAAALARIGGAA